MPPTPRAALVRPAGFLVAALLAGNLIAQPLRALRDWYETDYVSAYRVAARMLSAHAPCLYCLDAQLKAQRDLLGNLTVVKPNPYENAPLAAWLIQPLAALPPTVGLGIFLVLLSLATLAAILLVDRWLLPTTLGGEHRALLAIAAVATWPAAEALAIAGWDPLVVVCAIAAVYLCESGSPGWAGGLIAVMAVKPQIVWLVVVAMVVASQWRMLRGFAIGAGVWALSTLALLGPDHVLDWARLLLAVPYNETPQTLGIPGAVALANGSFGGFATALIGGIAAMALLVAMRHRLKAHPALLISTGLGLSLLLAPHVWPADLMIAAVPIAILARRSPDRALAIALTMSAILVIARSTGLAWVGHCEAIALAWLVAELYLARPAQVRGHSVTA